LFLPMRNPKLKSKTGCSKKTHYISMYHSPRFPSD
jgi:hypothetical protein